MPETFTLEKEGVQCIPVVVQFGPATDYTKRSALHAIVVKLGPATDVHCSERKWTDSPVGFNLSHASPNYSVKPLLQTHYTDDDNDDDKNESLQASKLRQFETLLSDPPTDQCRV